MISDEILRKALIIDVRENFEYVSKHIRGSINFPLPSIPYKIKELKSYGGPIVLYCKNGIKSGKAMGFLKLEGINDVFNGGSIEDMVRNFDSLAFNF